MWVPFWSLHDVLPASSPTVIIPAECEFSPLNPLILDRSDQDLPREPSNSQIVIPVTLHSFFVITLFGSKCALERIFKTPPVYSDRWFCSLQSPELKSHSRCPSLCNVFACS